MNIQNNEVMVLGGRPGQFFDKWDDKTFVYSWNQNGTGIRDGGKWIDTGNNASLYLTRVHRAINIKHVKFI